MVVRTMATPEVAADHMDVARGVLRLESRALLEVSDRLGDTFLRVADWIHQTEGSVLVTGMGKSGYIAAKLAATLASIGVRAHFLHPAEAIHGDLGRVFQGDLLLALSHSGETEEVVKILPPARRAGATVAGITGRGGSTLARLADAVVCYGAVEEACPIGLAPTTSCSVMLAIGDALAVVLMKLRGTRDADFGRNHPGGSLGKRLRLVDDIMRVGEQMRVVASARTVLEVFSTAAKPGRRSGAVLLVDKEGRLEGIFTDSDLARLFERRDPGAFDKPISEVMTRRPITLRVGEPIARAVELFRDRQISEIPVLDLSRRPVGLVDITDVIDLLPEAA